MMEIHGVAGHVQHLGQYIIQGDAQCGSEINNGTYAYYVCNEQQAAQYVLTHT
jgi:hypothetical protein